MFLFFFHLWEIIFVCPSYYYIFFSFLEKSQNLPKGNNICFKSFASCSMYCFTLLHQIDDNDDKVWRTFFFLKFYPREMLFKSQDNVYLAISLPASFVSFMWFLLKFCVLGWSETNYPDENGKYLFSLHRQTCKNRWGNSGMEINKAFLFKKANRYFSLF